MTGKITFEKAVARLDEVVKTLEKGDVPLDKSLSLFEEGTGLIKACSEMLDKAEQKVILLTKGENGEPVREPFEDEVAK